MPHADGDREALRILLGARQNSPWSAPAQTSRLRALLLGGGDTERDMARATLTDPELAGPWCAGVNRHGPARCEQAVRHGDMARATLTDPMLLAMVRRREPPQAGYGAGGAARRDPTPGSRPTGGGVTR